MLIALADYAHDDGTKAFPAIDTLAAHSRLSRRGVQAALRKLEQDGHIIRTGQTKTGTHVYSIVGMGGEGTTSQETARGEADALITSRTSPNPFKEPSVSFPEGKEVASSQVNEIFNHWVEAFGKTKGARLTPERSKKIRARLSQGYSPETLKRAVDGCAGSDWHVDGGHIDLTLICRNGEKVEKFAAMPTRDGSSSDHQRQVEAALSASPQELTPEDQAILDELGVRS